MTDNDERTDTFFEVEVMTERDIFEGSNLSLRIKGQIASSDIHLMDLTSNDQTLVRNESREGRGVICLLMALESLFLRMKQRRRNGKGEEDAKGLYGGLGREWEENLKGESRDTE